MLLAKMGLLWGMLALSVPVHPPADGHRATGGSSLAVLLEEEHQLQQKVKEIHRQFLQTAGKLKELDRRTGKANTDTRSPAAQSEQPLKTAVFKAVFKYGILGLPMVTASDRPVWSWAESGRERQEDPDALRERLVKEKEQLQAKQRQLYEQWHTVSSKIAKATGADYTEGCIEGLDLEKLAGKFSWPVPATKEVSSDYGWRRLNGEMEFHSGIDVAADLGDPIHASADGVVLYAGPARGFGNWIVIRHERGLMTVYGHMYPSGVNVKPGQTVRKGELIGRVGAAGQSFGPHLHFAVATGMKDGVMLTVNPWNFLEIEA